jgi:uracil-DNA glycosylase family 4
VSHLPLIRGTDEGADCANCPFSKHGLPHNPVFGEGPEHPSWIIIGEGPGLNEVRNRRPFIGATGELVNKMLANFGRKRTFAEPSQEIWMGNATLCTPPQGATEADRERAAAACGGRLKAELAQFPGLPVLTLGAVAARATIPKETLAAIDPPDTPKSIRKAQKLRQQPVLKNAIARRKAIDKATTRRLAALINAHRRQLIKTTRAKFRRNPDERYLQQETNRVHAQLSLKARQDAIKEIDLRLKERELKKLANKDRPKKAKPKRVKITDICGSLFDVDIDGSGVRPLVPAIHPAALLRGGGASIAGSHTPDMAWINLLADAGKIDAIARGRGADVRLKLNIEYELYDEARAVDLFLRVWRDALEEGACSLDLETYVDDADRHHALMAYIAKIRVIGLATKRGGISLAWDILPDWLRPLLQLLLTSVEMTFHNGLYDRTVLQNQHYGFEVSDEYFCTMLAHHAAFPGNSHRLQSVGTQFYGLQPWKSEYRNSEETLEGLAIYNAKDTGVTHALRAPLTFYINKNRVKRVYEIDKKMADMAGRMHLAGMPVDRGINEELVSTFSRSVNEARRQVEDIARDPKNREQIWHYLAIGQAEKQRKLDPKDFEERYRIRLSALQLDPDWRWKIGAGKHIAALLQTMGVQLYQRTNEGRGELSTKKDILEGLTDYPIVREIIGYREATKLLETFLMPIFDRHDGHGNILQYGYADANSRVHPIWKVHLISGRWASVWPVVSNVPKDKWKKLLGDALLILLGVPLPTEDAIFTLPDKTVIRFNKKLKTFSKLVRPNLRRQIKCRPGRMIVGFDYGQIEARAIALISGDPFLTDCFNDPSRDIHREVAAVIFDAFNQLDVDMQAQVREQTKPIEYGWMYLAQAETLHKQLLKEGFQIKFVDLLKAYARLEKLMPGVRRWQQQSVAIASKPPYQIREPLLGRFRMWPLGSVEAAEACNSGVQPLAAAIMNQGMARFMTNSMHKYRELDPLAQVHDAAYFECWEDDADRLGRDIKRDFECEEQREGRTVRFPVTVKKAISWDLL